MKPYYLFSAGTLYRKDNTLYFRRKSGDEEIKSVALPVEQIESLYLFGKINLSTGTLNFLGKSRITTFVFDYHQNLTNVIYPRDYLISGHTLVKQVEAYLNPNSRLRFAQKFVQAGFFNIEKNLAYYSHRMQDESLTRSREIIKGFRERLSGCRQIEEVMAFEGNVRKLYYSQWGIILGERGADFPFVNREKRPPSNELNALISWGNTICYTSVLKQIYRTNLNPTISYLHECSERRYSLALDIAEVFKPILVDKMIFSLINTREIRPKHFEPRLGGVYLREEGRRIWMAAWDKKMATTIQLRDSKKKISYETLIRRECYKIVKDLLSEGSEPYSPFQAWW